MPLRLQRHVPIKPTRVAALGLLLIAATGCRSDADATKRALDPHLVSEVVHRLFGTMRVERLSPPVASRVAAHVAMALYAGAATTDLSLRPLPSIVPALPTLPSPAAGETVDPTLTAIAAYRVVMDSLLREALPTTRSAQRRFVDSVRAVHESQDPDSMRVARSAAIGQAIGLALVAWSHGDGFEATRQLLYTPPVGETLWINDAPATLYATQTTSAVSEFVATDNPANQQRSANVSDRSLILSRPKATGEKTLPAANIAGVTEPYWGRLRRYVVTDTLACRAGNPPAYGTDSTAPLFREARQVYAQSRRLTDEERTIAYYWADNAGETGTPVGHWLSIAAQMINERGLTGTAAIQLLLGTSLAQADAFIAAWQIKFATNTLRPRTVIRRVIDSTWEPVIPTPPFPEFPSGHSTQSSAAAAVLTALLGPGPFRDSTGISIGHAVRIFPSFRAASEEAGRSRVLAGLHYEVSNQGGLRLGRCIGERVARQTLDSGNR
jgi:hypothetical protein